MRLLTDDTFVLGLRFCENSKPSSSGSVLEAMVIDQIKAYFSHELYQFDLPLKLTGTTFQKKAWQALLSIPYGKTMSYQQQLEMMGYRYGAQAVGQANKKNPIQLIIPCHRVLLSNGKLGGYQAGAQKKAFLLSHENACTIDNMTLSVPDSI